MKCSYFLSQPIRVTCRALQIAALLATLYLPMTFLARANDQALSQIDLDRTIRSLSADNIHVIDKLATDFRKERRDFIGKLTTMLKSEKSSNLSQCASAYYLGETRDSESVATLVDRISLHLDMSKINIIGLPPILAEMGEYPAMNALIKIGLPSIPALIQNLEISSDTKVRDLSLKTLLLIDKDKDIVQMRLQKALRSEKNAPRQAQLKIALEALGNSSFVK
jgi:hypothetical protein